MHVLPVRRRRGRELHDHHLILSADSLRKHLMILPAFALSISPYPQTYQKGVTTIVDAHRVKVRD